MKKLLLASAGILSLCAGAFSANAADLPRRLPAKAPAYVAPLAYNWTGLYVGINGGGGFGRSDFSGPAFPAAFNTSGGLVGGTLGYNWQAQGSPFVFGLETDLDWSGIKGSGACGVTTCSTSNTYLGTFRGRVGYAWDRVMPYITGGLAYGNINTNVAGFGTGSSTRAGWTLGGGLEFAIAGPWTAKVEYLYVDLGRGGGIPALAGDAKFQANVVRAGLNYRF
ncbi:MAG TPA: outer membrane protein [Pseudolabrys sp.]|nr:outer membrane protein [Pseudolabrys sp.]